MENQVDVPCPHNCGYMANKDVYREFFLECTCGGQVDCDGIGRCEACGCTFHNGKLIDWLDGGRDADLGFSCEYAMSEWLANDQLSERSDKVKE